MAGAATVNTSNLPAGDPRAILDREPMSGFQWIIVAIMVGLNALDGFDVLSISYASNGIRNEWGLAPDALGIVLSMELAGMAVGSLVLGGVADAVGRRTTIIGSLLVMAAGMFAAAAAHNVTSLCIYRLITGLGIGGLLAAINAASAEAANARNRALAVIIMAAGYPMGSAVGGTISGFLLEHFQNWRAIFVFGGIVTLVFVPLVLWRSPESIAFEVKRGGADALARINRTLTRMGHPAATVLPEPEVEPKKASTGELFSSSYATLSVMLVITYFAHILTFYYIIKWIPRLVAQMGYPASAGNVLVAASVGGMLGALLLGLCTLKGRVTTLTIISMVLGTVFVIVFGMGWKSIGEITLAAGAAGFFTNAPIVGIYAIVAKAFPTHIRASATGLVIGIGRGGAAVAPALAGFLFAGGFSLLTVSIMLGMGSAIAAIALFSIRKQVMAAGA